MMDRTPNCAKCGKPVDKYTEIRGPWPGSNEDTYHHIACADFDTPMDPASHARFNSHQIRKLQAENAALRQRTDTLLSVTLNEMRRQGATKQEIEDISKEFHFYDSKSKTEPTG